MGLMQPQLLQFGLSQIGAWTMISYA